MDISPMSLQAIVPKSSEVTQMQHNMNQQVMVQQDFESIRQKADAQHKQQQVRSKDEADGGKIKEEPDRRNKQGQYEARKGNSGENPAGDEAAETENMALDTFRGHHIDIKF